MRASPADLLFLLILTGAAASLPACGKKDAAPETGEAVPAEVAGPALPKAHYWKVISPFVAGSYAAQCLPFPEPKAYADTLSVAPDGRVTAVGLNEDLAHATSIVLGRATDKGVTENVMRAELGEAQLIMLVRSEGGVASWSVLKKDKQSMCEKSVDMAGLKGKKWITALAPTLTTLPRKIACIPTGEVKQEQEQVDFRLTDGVAMLNKEVYEL